MNFQVLPKDAPGGQTVNKCPMCRYAWQDFMDVGASLGLERGVLLGCYVCGIMFVSKPVRDFDKNHKREAVESESLPVGEPSEADDFVAICGKVCKTKAGLLAHERKCNKCKAVQE